MGYFVKAKIGINLKRLRKEKGLSRRQAADYCDVTEQFIGLLERGESIPGAYVMFQLAELYECSVEDFIVWRKGVEKTC